MSTLPGCATSWARSRNSTGVRCTGASGARDVPVREVDRDVAEFDDRRVVSRATHAAAEHRAQPRRQLGDAEGLGQVVVRAGVERLDLRRFLGARGQDEDRQRRERAHVANEVDAVAVRQAEIEDRDVGLARARLDDAALDRLGLADAIALVLERRADEAADLAIVLDDRICGAVSAGIALRLRSGGGGGVSSAGSVNTKRAPPPSRFSARIVPRCASTIARQIASPRPTPGTTDS